jgi:hypothetical protein
MAVHQCVRFHDSRLLAAVQSAESASALDLLLNQETFTAGDTLSLTASADLGGENEKCTQVVSGSNSLIYLLL